MVSKVKLIDNILPKEINNNILGQLFNSRNWGIAYDKPDFIERMILDNQPNEGFNILSYDNVKNIKLNTPLNIYADTILYKVKEILEIDFLEPSRYYWNYYDNSATTHFHTDESKDYITILYNLHNNDGGTEIKINNKTKFYKSIESQALIFPSHFHHRGIVPKENKHRLNLNIIARIKKSYK